MKTLKFLTLAAIFLAAFSFTAQAQSQSEPESEPDPYNREIGFGTNILLNTIFSSQYSQSAPLDFIYKWRSGNGYYRLGTSIVYSKRDEFRSSEHQAFYEYFHSNLIFGREWRQKVSKRWQVNYGSDFVARYRNSFNRSEHLRYLTGSENNTIERINVHKYSDNQYGLSLRPFLGVLFMINEKLYLGTEASFAAGFMKKISEKEIYTTENGKRIDNNTLEGFNPTNGYDVSISTNAASNIFLYYRF